MPPDAEKKNHPRPHNCPHDETSQDRVRSIQLSKFSPPLPQFAAGSAAKQQAQRWLGCHPDRHPIRGRQRPGSAPPLAGECRHVPQRACRPVPPSSGDQSPGEGRQPRVYEPGGTLLGIPPLLSSHGKAARRSGETRGCTRHRRGFGRLASYRHPLGAKSFGKC